MASFHTDMSKEFNTLLSWEPFRCGVEECFGCEDGKRPVISLWTAQERDALQRLCERLMKTPSSRSFKVRCRVGRRVPHLERGELKSRSDKHSYFIPPDRTAHVYLQIIIGQLKDVVEAEEATFRDDRWERQVSFEHEPSMQRSIAKRVEKHRWADAERVRGTLRKGERLTKMGYC